MQQPGAMFRIMPSFPHTNITTEQIQKYLDENKKLILAILDNQNLGKLAECAQYQAQLQKNLMYLAAIADGQPQTPTMTPQMTLHPAMQQGTFYMQQHPQAAAMTPQPGMFPQRAPFNSSHSVQDSHQHLHQQANQGQTPPRPVGPSNGANQTPQNDANLGVGSGNKQDKGEASSEWHGKSGVANGREAK